MNSAPSPPKHAAPAVSVWPAGRPMIRCASTSYPGNQPYVSGANGRFHPIVDGHGQPVPVLYAADLASGAVAEVVMRDVPSGTGFKPVPYRRFVGKALFELIPRRDLQLADFTDAGLRRLGTQHSALIDTDQFAWPQSRSWAQWVYDSSAYDGILWMARNDNRSEALLLFGDRVASDDVPLAAAAPALLTSARGFAYAAHLADRLGATIIGMPGLG